MIQMIPNINIILAIKTENIVFAIYLAIIITMTYFILPLSIATISTTLKVVFLKEYKYTIQCVPNWNVIRQFIKENTNLIVIPFPYKKYHQD